MTASQMMLLTVSVLVQHYGKTLKIQTEYGPVLAQFHIYVFCVFV